jgi:hypothetical protein
MTRHGSLVYYLTSWICGGLFLTVAMFLQDKASPSGMGMGPSGAGAAILTTYFLVLVFCAFLSLLFAFLLRRFTGWLRFEELWEWALAGAILAVPLAYAVRWASHFTDVIGLQGTWHEVAVFLFLGARGIAEHHLLLALPVAAANSAVLFLIHRAFAQPWPSKSEQVVPAAKPRNDAA